MMKKSKITTKKLKKLQNKANLINPQERYRLRTLWFSKRHKSKKDLKVHRKNLLFRENDKRLKQKMALKLFLNLYLY